MYPGAERTQDVIQDCSTAEAFKCRLELCVYDSAAPPSKVREHWPAMWYIRRAQPPHEKPFQANVYESENEGDEESPLAEHAVIANDDAWAAIGIGYR